MKTRWKTTRRVPRSRREFIPAFTYVDYDGPDWSTYDQVVTLWDQWCALPFLLQFGLFQVFVILFMIVFDLQ